jgi:nitrogen fixation protein FixH
MSFIDSVPPMRAPGPGNPAEAPRRSSWQWFPWAVAGALAVVVVVNAGMMWAALSTFPGAAGSDGFDLSNSYDRVLDRAARQAALGWTVVANLDTDAHAVIALIDRTGNPLAGAQVEARAERPVGPAETATLTFQAAPGGAYRAVQALAEPGQWDLQISVRVDDKVVNVTRRVIVR